MGRSERGRASDHGIQTPVVARPGRVSQVGYAGSVQSLVDAHGTQLVQPGPPKGIKWHRTHVRVSSLQAAMSALHAGAQNEPGPPLAHASGPEQMSGAQLQRTQVPSMQNPPGQSSDVAQDEPASTPPASVVGAEGPEQAESQIETISHREERRMSRKSHGRLGSLKRKERTGHSGAPRRSAAG